MNTDIIHLYNLAFVSGAPGAGELIVLFIIILLLFGPKKLPTIARSVGKTLDELRKASNDFKDQIMKIDEHPSVDIPADDISDDEPFDYGSEDGFDELNMHMDDPDYDHGEDIPGDLVDEDKDAGVKPAAATEDAGNDGGDSVKDDNAG